MAVNNIYEISWQNSDKWCIIVAYKETNKQIGSVDVVLVGGNVGVVAVVGVSASAISGGHNHRPVEKRLFGAFARAFLHRGI